MDNPCRCAREHAQIIYSCAFRPIVSRCPRDYREHMSPLSGSLLSPMADAAARTAAAGTARLLAAWCMGSPLPEAADRRCEGVADLAARRARVSQSLFFTDGATADLTGRRDDDPDARDLPGDSEMVYDGANAYVRVGGSWTGFFLADPAGPRGPNDPLWPLDALFGASGDAAEIGPEAVRGVPATRYRVTVDLARADAALPAGVSVPSGPYRSLRALPAEGMAGRGRPCPPHLGELRARHCGRGLVDRRAVGFRRRRRHHAARSRRAPAAGRGLPPSRRGILRAGGLIQPALLG